MSTDPTALAREVLDLTHEDETVTVCSVPDNKAAALARAVLRVEELADRLDDGHLRHVEPGQPVAGAAVLPGVHHPGDGGRLLGELLDGRGLLEHLVADRGDPAVAVGAEPHPRYGRGAVARQREQLLAVVHAGADVLQDVLDEAGRRRQQGGR